MELKEMIDGLLKSDIIENQELAATILSSPDIPDDEKIKYIQDFFIKNFSNYTGKDKDNLFKAWLSVYNQYLDSYVKNRVTKI